MENKYNSRPNLFFTLVFAFLPGLAHLYMGMVKKGLTLLGSFVFCVVACIVLGRFWILNVLFVIPMVMLYCYCFFDSFTTRRVLLSGVQPEDTCALTRFYQNLFMGAAHSGMPLVSKRVFKITGIVLLALGCLAIVNELSSVVYYFYDDRSLYPVIMDRVFTFIIPVALVVAGILLIRRGVRQKPGNNVTQGE